MTSLVLKKILHHNKQEIEQYAKECNIDLHMKEVDPSKNLAHKQLKEICKDGKPTIGYTREDISGIENQL